jgi:flagellar motility protein MotE (MotC chaperone)
MNLTAYSFFAVVNFVYGAKEEDDATSSATIPNQKSLVQNQESFQTLNDIPILRSEAHDHTQAILDYIEEFNNGNIHDQAEINKYLANQDRLKTLHDSYSSQEDQRELDSAERDVELLNLLKKEFVKNYRSELRDTHNIVLPVKSVT